MSKPYKLRGSALALLLLAAPLVSADNAELWDWFPAQITFSQYEGDVWVYSDTSPWFSFPAAGDLLDGLTIDVTVVDAQQKVSLDRPDLALFSLVAGPDWNLKEVFSGDFSVDDCGFTFTSDMGVLLLPSPEGYRIATREILAWSGPPDACREMVGNYIDKASITPVMPLHLAAWGTIGGPQKPADTGQFEVIWFQDLHRTRLLLPLEATAEVDAGLFQGQMGSPGTAEQRFELIKLRLGNLMFADGFEP